MRIAVLFLVFGISVSSGNDTISYREAVEFRMQAVEDFLGVSFDGGWFPEVSFSLPDYYDTSAYSRKNILAHYSVEKETIFLNPQYVDSAKPLLRKDFVRRGSVYFEDTSWSGSVRTMLDHELGHALADQFSRRLGLGPWPPFRADRESWDGWRIVGNDILMEGVGEFFGRLSMRSDATELSFLPDTLPHFGWWLVLRGLLAYSGGYALVYPILHEYGTAGLTYLIRNPLIIEDRLLRRSAMEYQKKAMRVLEYTK